MFLGKTLYSHIAFLHPGVKMGTGKCNAEGKPCDGLASHPGESRNTPSRFVLLNHDKLRPGGPCGSHAYLTFFQVAHQAGASSGLCACSMK